MQSSKSNVIIYLLLTASVLVIVGTCCGIFIPVTYGMEIRNWKLQAFAQDIMDLLIGVPFLLISGFMSLSGKKIAIPIFGGTLLFLIYSYMIYCFALHFNFLFPVYCFTLGSLFYLFIFYIHRFLPIQRNIHIRLNYSSVVSVFFGLIAVFFYFAWLGEIVPAILNKKIPLSLIDSGMLVNPVHVLDLSFILPGFVIVAVLLRRSQPIAIFFAPLLLIFSLLMNVNIAVISVVMRLKGESNSVTTLFIMGLLAVVCTLLFIITSQQKGGQARRHL